MNYKSFNINLLPNLEDQDREMNKLPTSQIVSMESYLYILENSQSIDELLKHMKELGDVLANNYVLIEDINTVNMENIFIDSIQQMISEENNSWLYILYIYTNWIFKTEIELSISDDFFSLISEQLYSRYTQLQEMDFDDPERPEIIINASLILSWISNVLHDDENLLNLFVKQEIHLSFPYFISVFTNFQRCLYCITILSLMIESGYTKLEYYFDSFEAIKAQGYFSYTETLLLVSLCVDVGGDFILYFNNIEFIGIIGHLYSFKALSYGLRILRVMMKSQVEGVLTNIIMSGTLGSHFALFKKIIGTDGKPLDSDASQADINNIYCQFYEYFKRTLKSGLAYSEIVRGFDPEISDIMNRHLYNGNYEVRIAALDFCTELVKHLEIAELYTFFESQTIIHLFELYELDDASLYYKIVKFLLVICDAGIRCGPCEPRPPKHKENTAKHSKLNFFTIANHLTSEEFDESIAEDIENAPEDYIDLANQLHDKVEELIEVHGQIMNSLNEDGLIDFGELEMSTEENIERSLDEDFGFSSQSPKMDTTDQLFVYPFPY